MRRFIWIWVGLIGVVFSLILTFSGFYSTVIFGYDQARDAFEAYKIYHYHHLKILGPPSSFEGFYHGVIWYYLIAVFYGISSNPAVATQIFAVFLYLSIPLAWFVAYKLFHNVKIAAMTVVFYSLSPLFIASMSSLYNPGSAFIIAPLLLFVLWKYIHTKKPLTSFFIGILFGLLIQFNFQYLLILSTIFTYIWYFKLRIKMQDIISFIIGLLISLSTFIVADIKFGGKTVINIIRFFTNSNNFNQSASQILLTITDKIVDFIYITFLPLPKVIVLFVAITTAIYLFRKLRYKKNPQVAFLLIWLSNILIYACVRSDVLGVLHTFNPSLLALVILGAAILVKLTSNNIKLLIITVLIGLLEIILTINWRNSKISPLTPQQGIFLKDEIAAIDSIYKRANGKPFTISTYTNPLEINTLWAYLYRFYGEKKYGYVPYWGGQDQKGYLGDLPQKTLPTKQRFVIIEPDVLTPNEWLIRFGQKEDLIADFIKEEKFGGFRVQERIVKSN